MSVHILTNYSEETEEMLLYDGYIGLQYNYGLQPKVSKMSEKVRVSMMKQTTDDGIAITWYR